MKETHLERFALTGRKVMLKLGINRLIEIRIGETASFYLSLFAFTGAYLSVFGWLIFGTTLSMAIVVYGLMIGSMAAAVFFILYRMEYPIARQKRKNRVLEQPESSLFIDSEGKQD